MRSDGPVLIGLDGSPASARTLDWGLDEAALLNAPVLLARAWTDPRDLLEWSWYPVVADGLDTEAQTFLAAQVPRASERHPGLSIETRLLRGGQVPELRRLSDGARLLVLGARGHTGRGDLGSTTRHLSMHARCPVAVVRDGPEAVQPDAPVVVGVDGSRSSLFAADSAAREASLRGAPLVVLHARATVADPHGGGLAVLPPLVAGGAVAGHSPAGDPTHGAAQDLADRIRAKHPDLAVRLTLVDDDPVHALVASSRRAALLVVGSRGLGAFRGLLLGSVSMDVLRGAATTVLVARESRSG